MDSEWKKSGKTKQPYCFEVGDGEIFAFAGLWDKWTDPRGEILESCTILTTSPNAILADVHDRMPVILSPENYAAWLNPMLRDAAVALGMLRLYCRPMCGYPVSTRLNQVKSDDADCARPLDLEAPPRSEKSD